MDCVLCGRGADEKLWDAPDSDDAQMADQMVAEGSKGVAGIDGDLESESIDSRDSQDFENSRTMAVSVSANSTAAPADSDGAYQISTFSLIAGSAAFARVVADSKRQIEEEILSGARLAEGMALESEWDD